MFISCKKLSWRAQAIHLLFQITFSSLALHLNVILNVNFVYFSLKMRLFVKYGKDDTDRANMLEPSNHMWPHVHIKKRI